jgi:hypothetical protein
VPFPHPGRKGFVFSFWNEVPDATVVAHLERVRAAGAAHLTVPVIRCQDTPTSSEVKPCGLLEERLSLHWAELARARGFSVSLLPIVTTPGWDWRGTYDPADPGAWFTTYGAWIKGLALLSRQRGYTELVVGTELSRIFRQEARWKALLAEVRPLFPGPLVLTVNWDDLEHGFWEDADAVGVSAYAPLTGSADPAVPDPELRAGAARFRDAVLDVAARAGRPVHLTEFGFPAVPTAAVTPWEWYFAGPGDSGLQARCFAAFTEAWRGQPALARANAWITSGPAAPPAAAAFDVIGRPAELVLKAFFLDGKSSPE